MLDWFLVGLGLTILLLSGDLLVRGAVNLSLRLGIPPLLVSLTIVAFGTSAPELLITIEAVGNGFPGMALGNIIGSNIANVLLVLGIPALITTMHTAECNTRKSYIFMLGATGLFIVMCFFGPLSWPHGLIMLGVLVLILIDAGRDAMRHRSDSHACALDLEEVEGADPKITGKSIAFFLVIGLIGLPLGADLFIDGAVNIAEQFGVSDTVIGLTLVAIGTSLPELATTVMAALRRQADVALGNVIGSNMFNILAIMGVGSLIGTIPVPHEILTFDLWVMLAASLVLFPFVLLGWNLSRIWGIVLSSAYLVYMGVVLIN
ncbi:MULTISPECIES: calcium/sodium antiporter [Falsihalocynthiibacter]|uniref:Sodium:proton exchanger n=1 Tax=Falsihalocynthiibacter arcticus TaxID=1579316 RepID=A0A126UZZ0_9RHOB|nr:calcium/sodium antiporter [Falsihalocynthiibacter arcticus]AML51196.1 sodium:proton exchanger [Falsihalocynthiibacter arcticus]